MSWCSFFLHWSFVLCIMSSFSHAPQAHPHTYQTPSLPPWHPPGTPNPTPGVALRRQWLCDLQSLARRGDGLAPALGTRRTESMTRSNCADGDCRGLRRRTRRWRRFGRDVRWDPEWLDRGGNCLGSGGIARAGVAVKVTRVILGRH